jgi:arsenate reductase (thioredoxin)
VPEPINVLFLCTGNSCRSQMAEGWLKHLGGDRFNARSAGIEAHGKNPRAIAAMKEVGSDISGQESEVFSAEMLRQADVVITVCGHADERCPVLPRAVRKEHWPLADPAQATGTDEEITQVFRTTCDEIGRKVRELVARGDKQ